MTTPVFHPNIDPQKICIGDHWSAGQSLGELIVRIGEMICYQSYNVKSPLNGEAAAWAQANLEQLPLDHADMTGGL
jgi:ubiquitin-protein ligase